MRSSLRFPRRLPNVLGFLLLTGIALAPATAQEPTARPGATEAVVALGESLFKNPRLSSTGKMSCATCHVPERAFTEDKPVAVGQHDETLGRNTPTLVGLASVKEFPVGGSFAKPPEMSSLEKRVVLPLEDVAEMSGSVSEAVERLANDPQSVEKFNEAFEEAGSHRPPVGVTGDRLAAALAAYVRSIQPREAPGRKALAGAEVALDEPATRGLALFKGEGRCQSCHSGPDLTDGNLHVVSKFRPQSFTNRAVRASGSPEEIKKARDQARERVREVAQAASLVETRPVADTRPRHTVAARRSRGGAYGPSMSLERQTLTLLDVKRTGPWFRDGSAATLSEAVRRHVSELREVGALREDVGANPLALFGKPRQQAIGGRPRVDILSPSAKAQIERDDWIPAEITTQQVDDLVAFLGTLSPAD
jgi:cytochrome c peroxidase